MSKPKIQQEFEEWVKGRWPNTVFDQFNQGEYCGFTLEHCWQAWQASRAALVIELPQRANGTTLDLPGSDGENDYLLPETLVRQTIESCGIKVTQ